VVASYITTVNQL